jgi:hypothetical protein
LGDFLLRDLKKVCSSNFSCYLGLSLMLHCLCFTLFFSTINLEGRTTKLYPLSVTLQSSEHAPTQDINSNTNNLVLDNKTSEKPSNQAPPSDALPNIQSIQSQGLSITNPNNPEFPKQERMSYLQKYFFRSELSIPPAILEDPIINLDEEKLIKKPQSGSVKFRLFINSNGQIDRAEIISGATSEAHNSVVLNSFTPLKFRPGEINGRPVNSQVVFEVDLDTLAEGLSQSSDQALRLINPPSR